MQSAHRTAPPAGPSGRPLTPLHVSRRTGVSLLPPRRATPGDDGGDGGEPSPPQPPRPTPRRRRPRRALDPVEQATFAEWARGFVSGSGGGAKDKASGGAPPPTPANAGWGRTPPPPAAALDSGAYEGAPGSPEATLQNVLAVSLALLLGAALAGMAVRVVAVAAALAAAALRYTVVAVLLLFFALFFTP